MNELPKFIVFIYSLYSFTYLKAPLIYLDVFDIKATHCILILCSLIL